MTDFQSGFRRAGPIPTLTINGDEKSLEALKRFENLVGNAMSMRSELFSKFLDPRRKIEDECGYPTGTIDAQTYQKLFDTDPVANRVVEILPKETWQVQPTIFEDEDSKNATKFEKAWDEVCKNLRGKSWYQDEAGNPVWDALSRADILSGIGTFGVLLLGLNDGKDLAEPVEGVPSDGAARDSGTVTTPQGMGTDAQYGYSYLTPLNKSPSKKKGPLKLLFLRPFSENLVQISSYESDMTNPRFGLPIMYLITLNDPQTQHGGIGLPLATMRVHWSRVIHIADNLCNSEIFGLPRMRPVFERILDLRKLYGGSAEMYWRGAFPGYVLSTHPQLGGDVEVDTASVQDQMEAYMNHLQRYVALSGMSMTGLAPQVVDPTQQIDAQIKAICIKIPCPMRVFMGSERGELASSQDDSQWNDVLRGRQIGYATPRIICPLVDRLIMIGILPEPDGYSCDWPDLDSLGEKDKATVCSTNTAALASYVGGNVATIITPQDFLTHEKFLGMDEEEALQIMENAKKLAEEAELEQQQAAEEQAAQAEAQGMIPNPPEGFQQPAPPVPAAPTKVKPGEKLVHPDSVKPPVKNAEDFDWRLVEEGEYFYRRGQNDE